MTKIIESFFKKKGPSEQDLSHATFKCRLPNFGAFIVTAFNIAITENKTYPKRFETAEAILLYKKVDKTKPVFLISFSLQSS